MDLLISIFKIFAAEGDIPPSYGSYHFMWVGITLAFAVFMVCAFKNLDDKAVRKLAGGFWIALVVLEIIKQLVFSLRVSAENSLILRMLIATRYDSYSPIGLYNKN